MDIQYWIKYAALAVVISTTIIVGDAVFMRWVRGRTAMQCAGETWLCGIAWALYFAL